MWNLISIQRKNYYLVLRPNSQQLVCLKNGLTDAEKNTEKKNLSMKKEHTSWDMRRVARKMFGSLCASCDGEL